MFTLVVVALVAATVAQAVKLGHQIDTNKKSIAPFPFWKERFELVLYNERGKSSSNTACLFSFLHQ